MARKKCRVSWSGYGYTGPNDYVYFEEDEMKIFREDKYFRISLVEKYYPSYWYNHPGALHFCKALGKGFVAHSYRGRI